ncbi:DUF7534 family protein [Halosimplex sp. J119]
MQLPSILVDRPLAAVAVSATALIVLSAPFVLAYWARCEARAKGSSTLDVFIYMSLVVGTVHYWYVRFVRGDDGPRESPPSGRERLAGTYATAVVVAYLIDALASPPDPVTQVFWFPPLFALSFAVTHLLTSASGRSRSAAVN